MEYELTPGEDYNLPYRGVRRRGISPQQRYDQLISLALDLEEQRLRDGTATAQEILWWAKQGSEREYLEKRNLELQGNYLETKIESATFARENEADYRKAIEAIKSYQPSQEIEDAEFREV